MAFDVYKIPSVGLRMFNVYGPGQPPNNPYSSVIPKFIRKILKNKPVTINGGFQTRDFIYVQDVLNIILKSMQKIQEKKNFEIFNLCTGRSIKINFLFKLIRKKIGTNPRVIRRKIDKFDPKKSSGNIVKLLKFLRIKKYNFTNLEDGLHKTITHIRSLKI